MIIKFPATIPDLEAAGYREDTKSVCKCGMTMTWFITPKGKKMPMTPKAETDLLEPHWASCANSADFRRKK